VSLWKAADGAPLGSFPMPAGSVPIGACSDGVSFWVALLNGGFETGSLSGWTTSGVFTPLISTTAHTGSYSARLGSTSPFNGNSTLTQTVVVPTGTSTLSFWYQPHCTDTITYDQIQMQVRSTAGATLATVMNVCSNSGAWTHVTFNMSSFAGQTIVLWFNDHDDNYPGSKIQGRVRLDRRQQRPRDTGPRQRRRILQT
jgi:hypothetical protein